MRSSIAGSSDTDAFKGFPTSLRFGYFVKTLPTITSRHNPLLQDLRRAVSAGRPTSEGWVVAEGPHLLEEALRGSWQLQSILATAAARHQFANTLALADAPIVEVSAAALASAGETEHGQGILSLLKPKVFGWDDLLVGPQTLVLVLDGVQDPGNAGTLVRSAEAFGVSGIVLTRSSVRITNGKFMRATAGSIFRLPYLQEIETHEILSQFKDRFVSLWALAPQGSVSLLDADLRSACALVVGNEGSGVSLEVIQSAQLLRIPCCAVESLNAAVAGSIALFEASRQRTQ